MGLEGSEAKLEQPEQVEVIDVVHLLERAGIPAGLHRQTISGMTNDEGLLVVNLDPIHQYMDDQLLEAILLVFGMKIGLLSLHDCWNVTDVGLAKIFPFCPNIQSINLSNCWALTEAGFLTGLASAPQKLRHVEITGCPGMTDAALAALATGCHALESLDVSFCKNLGNDTWSQLMHWAGTLKSLAMRRCFKVSGESIQSSLGTTVLSCLESLDLSDCSLLSDAAITAVVAKCPVLHSLSLSFCQDLDTEFISSLALANPQRSLRGLVLEYCHTFITDEAVACIVEGWPDLERILLKGCSLLTNDAVKALARLEHLKQVDLSSCPRISPFMLTVTALGRSWRLENPPSFM